MRCRGYVEVLRHYCEIVGIRRKLRAYFLLNPPDLFIGIDAPDFNLDLELKLKERGIPTIHYVSPSIWAWRGERIHKIKRAVSHMLALFPFEPPLYEKAGIPVTYVGHPLADMLPVEPNRDAMREQMRLPTQSKVFAFLPGSRQSEVRIWPQPLLTPRELFYKNCLRQSFLYHWRPLKRAVFLRKL